ncbi:serine hydrolase domain-containing protein [Flexibacterium corallicola]|uniref:serine hydrolase domain-containing protein n=1 Tax=Flexibacterium corallicola TaxID=3037259 RepID=UPI00286F2EAD|nr:serine hydrolase [Pseudovibrio sp. M1P-2-3]
MRKLISWTAASILTILAGTGLYFHEDIQKLRALKAYAKAFTPENIDNNMRTLHASYPSKDIAPPTQTYKLQEALGTIALPETFMYDGKPVSTLGYLSASHTTGFAVLQGDKLLYESYMRGNTRESNALQMSVSKSITSVLTGIAVDKGLIEDVEDQVVKYVPELKGSAYDGARLKDVLEMSSGIRWNEDYKDLDSDLVQSVVAVLTGSLDDYTKQVVKERAPGTQNLYASIDTYVLGWVIRNATGQAYEDWFNEQLWSKLGAEGSAKILVDTKGQPVVYGGFNLRLRDMIRFGKMVMDGGVNHKGERVVSQEWLRASVTPDSPRLQPGFNNPDSSSPLGYKYQWWLPLESDGGDFTAIGLYGQFIYVNPVRKVVIVKTSSDPTYSEAEKGLRVRLQTISMMQAIAKHLGEAPES